MRNSCGHRLLSLVCAILVVLFASVGNAQDAPGTISGTVLDVVTGDPVIDAGVELVGQKKAARTDIDGKFNFKLPPGSYEIRVFASGYQGARITKIDVKPAQVTLADTTLAPEGDAGVEVVEVVAQADRAAEKTQLLARQKAATVQETISAEVIKKSPDSDAAEVVQRVPAVTIKDNKFIFVRGLGERYSTALLNGSRLPSTDPNKRVVPLDLFPADFLASLAIIKSYTPDLPGDFSGGLVDINLRSFPTELEATIGMSLGANTQTTFQDFETYPGDAGDYFGVDTVRGLPGIFGDKPVRFDSQQQMFEYAKTLENVWSANAKTAPPNTGLNFSIGNSWGPFGVSFATNWSNEYKLIPNAIERQFETQGDPMNPEFKLDEDFVYDFNVFETRLGGLLTSAYELGSTGRLTFRGLYNRNSSDEVQLGRGTTSNEANQLTTVTRLQYTEEDLAYGQLAGEHLLDWLQVDWRGAFARSSQNVPDTRTTVYSSVEGEPALFSNASQGGTRIWFDIVEYMTDSAVDLIVPFRTWLPFTEAWDGLPAKLKFGPAYTYRDRTSNLRQFRYRARGPNGEPDLTAPPQIILDPDNIAAGLVNFEEFTRPSDSFKATEEIVGGYGMFDLPLVADLVRLVAGVRTEYSYIRLRTTDEQGQPAKVIINNTDPLPGINLIVTPRSDMNVRAGYSQTVSRPEFRELSPIEFPEPAGLRPTIGNPNLVESHIDSTDLRWEWFFSPLELVSASFFYKSIDKPIEQVLLVQSSNVANSFANSKSATLYGFEAEGRKHFGFIDRTLEKLSLSLNVAYIESDVTPAPLGQFEVQTQGNRPLQGQSPYVINANLEWTDPDYGTARLLYYTAGKRIAQLGQFGLPNIEEEPRNQLDFVYVNRFLVFGEPITGKFAVENLWNDHYLFKQGDQVQSRYRTGLKLGVSFSYAF